MPPFDSQDGVYHLFFLVLYVSFCDFRLSIKMYVEMTWGDYLSPLFSSLLFQKEHMKFQNLPKFRSTNVCKQCLFFYVHIPINKISSFSDKRMFNQLYSINNITVSCLQIFKMHIGWFLDLEVLNLIPWFPQVCGCVSMNETFAC